MAKNLTLFLSRSDLSLCQDMLLNSDIYVFIWYISISRSPFNVFIWDIFMVKFCCQWLIYLYVPCYCSLHLHCTFLQVTTFFLLKIGRKEHVNFFPFKNRQERTCFHFLSIKTCKVRRIFPLFLTRFFGS